MAVEYSTHTRTCTFMYVRMAASHRTYTLYVRVQVAQYEPIIRWIEACVDRLCMCRS
jgi:hypothetical protein